MNKRRPNQNIFRLSDIEQNKMCKRIERSGLTKQDYLRRAAIHKLIMNPDPVRKLYKELRKQGVNLNQITKKLNSTGFIDCKGELSHTLEELEVVWQSLREWLEKYR